MHTNINTQKPIGTQNRFSSCSFEKKRRPSFGTTPEILTDIYEKETNIAIWQRELSSSLQASVATFLDLNPNFQSTMTLSSENVLLNLENNLGIPSTHADIQGDIAELIDMFCYLFDLKRVGLRITALQSAMCPKFHVDRVLCRLVTTYQGTTTEWLDHDAVNRAKLGMGSNGKPDNESGLYQHEKDIRRLSVGDVALLKGETWENNELAGLVHRSPSVPKNQNRLLLTLDFSE
jgi:hypothetical protein